MPTAALLAAAGATIAFSTPVASIGGTQKRCMREVVRAAHRLSLVGLGLLAVAMGLWTWLFLSALWSVAAANVGVADCRAR